MAAQALHQPHVQPARIVQPDDQRPRFLRVPAPVAAPRFGGPQRAQNRRDREERETDRDRLVHHVVEHIERRQPARPPAAPLHQVPPPHPPPPPTPPLPPQVPPPLA